MNAEKKFEKIYYIYFILVSFIISKYIHNGLDVEELTNDVFINFNQANKNSKIKNVKRYLIISAKNTAINFRIKNDKEKIIYDDEIINDYNNEFDDFGYYTIIKDLLIYLSHEELNILLLHIVYDYKFKEIAKKLNYSEAKTKTIFYNAKQKIKKINENNEVFNR